MEERAFYAAVEEFGDTVTRVLLLRCRNAADAEDCFQNVFLKLLTCKTDFHDPSHVKAWLLRTAINEAADMNRRFWRRKVTLLGGGPLPGTEPLSQEAVLLLEALRSLPPHLRDVIYLRCCEGYSEAETAAILKLPRGTVKSRLSRARNALRELLEEEP